MESLTTSNWLKKLRDSILKRGSLYPEGIEGGENVEILQQAVEELRSEMQTINEIATSARNIANQAAITAATAGERAEEGIRRSDENARAIEALQNI